MLFEILVAALSLFMTFHKLNQVKEDAWRDDYLAWGFDENSWPTKVRKGATVGLDGLAAGASALTFVDSVSGGKIRTKAVRAFLDGFDSPDDLKDKLSKVLGKSESIKKDNGLVTVPEVKSSRISDDFANEHSITTTAAGVSSDKEKQYDSATDNRENSLSELSIDNSTLDASIENSSESSNDNTALEAIAAV